MKKINILFSLVILSGIIMSSASGGFIMDYTGSTGLSGTSCGASNCHMGTMGVDSTILNVRVLSATNEDITKTSSGYVMGALYNVEVRLKTNASIKAGFQCVPLTFMGAAATGNVLNTLMPNYVNMNIDAAGRQYMSHTVMGNSISSVIAGGWAIWKFQWTAPATNVGAINFHCIGNVTNNDFGSGGDSVKMAVYTIQAPQIATNIEQSIQQNELFVYPNPAQDLMQMRANTTQTINRVLVYNTLGMVVFQSKNLIEQIDVSRWANGNYIVVLETVHNKFISKRFTKQ